MRSSTWALAALALGWSCVSSAQADVEITAPGPLAPLHGSFVAPEADGPVVLIVPGSGPTDRDGNNPLGVSAASYRLLAEGLAARGIGSVRIDKRGMFASAAAVADPNAATIAGYVADVASWVDAARRASGAGCIWLAGHSEGGLVALASAEQVEGLCGLILLAAPGRPLGTIMREQFTANPANAPVLPDALRAIDALEAGESVDVSGFHPALQPIFAPQVQDYLREMMALDPAALAAGTALPVLIVQGAKDLQVSRADAEALHAARPDAGYVVLPDANHVFKSVAGDDQAANLAAYADPALPLASGLVEAIARFVTPERAN